MSSLKVTDIIKSAIEKSDSVKIEKTVEGTVLICERKATKQNPFGGKAFYPIDLACKGKTFSFKVLPKEQAHVASTVRAVYVNDDMTVAVEPYLSTQPTGAVAPVKVNAVYLDLQRHHVKAKEPTKIRLLLGCCVE
ncbi:MAG: hypothetical protein JW701_00855 [Kosmotogaceae bacterium]|nr:hypothetical protein [Kosmotogaceae bacterium]